MNKILSRGLAALMAVGSVLATTAPAAADEHGARGWGGERHEGWREHGDHDRGYGAGALIAGGIAGVALGAALSGPRYHSSYYGPAYYGPGVYDPYAYPPGYYGICISHHRVWDSYYGAWVVRPVRYAC